MWDHALGIDTAYLSRMRWFIQRLKWFRRRWWYWRLGERLAAFYLQCRGYRILGRNIRVCGVEVDIVAWRKKQLCVVEVKTRADEKLVAPEHSVDRVRRQRQWRAAESLYLNSSLPVTDVRFGIIAIVGWRLRFHIDAFDNHDL